MPFRLGNAARNRTVGLCVERAWMLVLGCDNGHGARLRPSQLAERFAPDVTLEAIAERLVCQTCGSRDGALDIMQDTHELNRRDVERYMAKKGAP